MATFEISNFKRLYFSTQVGYTHFKTIFLSTRGGVEGGSSLNILMPDIRNNEKKKKPFIRKSRLKRDGGSTLFRVGVE